MNETITLPAATSNGDMVVVALWAPQNVTGPAGYTMQYSDNIGAAYYWTFTHSFTVGDPKTLTFSFFTSNVLWIACSYKNVSLVEATPIGANGGGTNSSTTATATGSGQITANNNDEIVATYAGYLFNGTSTTVTYPGSLQQEAALQPGSIYLWLADQKIPTQGTATGTQTATLSQPVATLGSQMLLAPLRGPSRILFTTAPQTLVTWQCSGAMTIQNQDFNGNPLNAPANIVVNLKGRTIQYYSDSGCTNLVTSTTIPAGSNSQTFYAMFTVAGSGGAVTGLPLNGSNIFTQFENITTNNNVWIGGAACDGNWSTNNCWQGGAPPTDPIFDTNCKTNCAASLVGDISINSISMQTAFVGSVSMNGHNLSTRYFTLVAGTFNAGSGTLTVSSFIMTAGTFNPNTGTVLVRNNWLGFYAPYINLNNLILGDGQSASLNTGGQLHVTGNLTFNFPSGFNNGSGGNIIMEGSNPQTITDVGSGGAVAAYIVASNSSSGGITFGSSMALVGGFALLSGNVTVAGNYGPYIGGFDQEGGTFTSSTGTVAFGQCPKFGGGTFNANGGTVQIFSVWCDVTVNTTPQFYNVVIGNGGDIGWSLSGSTATINVSGNLTYNFTSNDNGGNGTVVMNGNGNAQIITDTNGGLGGSLTTNFLLENTNSGFPNFASNMHLKGTVEVVSGFSASFGGYNLNFGKLQIDPGGYFFSTTNTLTVGSAVFQSGGNFQSQGGTVVITGNWGTSDFENYPLFTNLVLGTGPDQGQSFAGSISITGNLTYNYAQYVNGGNWTINFITASTNETITDANNGSGKYLNANYVIENSGIVASFNSAFRTDYGVSVYSGTASMSGAGPLIMNSFSVSSGATFSCNGYCGAGTACGQGANDLQCSSFSNSGTITP